MIQHSDPEVLFGFSDERWTYGKHGLYNRRKVAEVLGAVLLTAASAFYVFLITKMSFHRQAPIASLALSLAVYGTLTAFAVRPGLISKAPEKLRKIRRACIAVKILLTAALLAARVILMFTVDVFLWFDF